MADGVTFDLDGRALQVEGDRITRRYLTAGTTAVVTVTKSLERDLEAATQAAVPGRLWRAWASRADPKRGPARNPTGRVFVNGSERTRGAIRFWTQPGSARQKDGFYFAVPLPAAGPVGRKRMLTPGEWERAHPGVRLRFVYRRGRASLLVADEAVLSGRKQVARRNTDRRIAAGRGSATVPIFALIPLIKFRNAVAVEPLVAAAEPALVREFLRAVQG